MAAGLALCCCGRRSRNSRDKRCRRSTRYSGISDGRGSSILTACQDDSEEEERRRIMEGSSRCSSSRSRSSRSGGSRRSGYSCQYGRGGDRRESRRESSYRRESHRSGRSGRSRRGSTTSRHGRSSSRRSARRSGASDETDHSSLPSRVSWSEQENYSDQDATVSDCPSDQTCYKPKGRGGNKQSSPTTKKGSTGSRRSGRGRRGGGERRRERSHRSSSSRRSKNESQRSTKRDNAGVEWSDPEEMGTRLQRAVKGRDTTVRLLPGWEQHKANRREDDDSEEQSGSDQDEHRRFVSIAASGEGPSPKGNSRRVSRHNDEHELLDQEQLVELQGSAPFIEQNQSDIQRQRAAQGEVDYTGFHNVNVQIRNLADYRGQANLANAERARIRKSQVNRWRGKGNAGKKADDHERTLEDNDQEAASSATTRDLRSGIYAPMGDDMEESSQASVFSNGS
ncbi:unnamed protein product [Amoebophrya sp. A25]|nr:unnamed protein product [Amoebophrya sp. A25]|eukprot:GSA25T00002577001.1